MEGLKAGLEAAAREREEEEERAALFSASASPQMIWQKQWRPQILYLCARKEVMLFKK